MTHLQHHVLYIHFVQKGIEFYISGQYLPLAEAGCRLLNFVTHHKPKTMLRTFNHSQKTNLTLQKRLDELLESTVERRSQRLDLLVEVNGSLSTLGNPLGGELELL